MSWITDNIQPDIAEYLFTIKVQLPDRFGLFQRDIRPDLNLDFDLLEEQLSQTHEMITFFNMVHAEQVCKVKKLERTVKALRGKISKAILDQDKDIRRTDISDIVNADASITRLEWQIIEESRIQQKLEATVDGFCKKFEALRSLSGFKREERKSAGNASG